jgi:signal transduction histidine kinase
MKKVALIFIIAVFVPSLVLAWLAVRSLRDQQIILERQQSLLCQGVADSLAKESENFLSERQHDFRNEVEALLVKQNPAEVAPTFDQRLRTNWPLAQVGFVVTLNGQLLCPSPLSSPAAQIFCADNGKFLGNREVAEVYWNPKGQTKGFVANDANTSQKAVPSPSLNQPAQSDVLNSSISAQQESAQTQTENSSSTTKAFPQQERVAPLDSELSNLSANRATPYFKNTQGRNVVPQNKQTLTQSKSQMAESQEFSKVSASEAEFRQLIGDSTEGALARFLNDKLNVLFWYRLPDNPELVFGAQLSLTKLTEGLRELLQQFHPVGSEGICIAILDDKAKPVALSHPDFRASWKRPFVATEIGEALPHWEVAVYLLNPAKLTQTARTLKLTLGLLILVLVLAIGIGSWLIVADLNRQLRLARQKTDFVSNVSHELKTPLTSIRMFSELLAEGRVADPARQRSYLNIITAEAARLTRLINNVLDFSRSERGEKKYNFQACDVANVVRETAETYRPHLEANGFKFECELPETPLCVNGDRDALAQLIVNLLSNAEKYADSRKEITVRVEPRTSPLPYVEVKVLDRGPGVPRGCEEKIFEQFYRAHDSLSSGIQGSGLGLTLARQIARAHGGDVVYEPREGGGSCFSLRLPITCSGGL